MRNRLKCNTEVDYTSPAPPPPTRVLYFSTNLMLSSNCIHSLPRRPQISQLSASSPRFRASKLTDKSSSAPTLSFQVSETHRRFSIKGK
ncbi:hypothetical protein C2S51_037766 [Perilla frutescens var. frutescens]|nr:hypothetical protein C2S51_037766 [Perilla frutescens var. frutescens]